MALWSEQTVEQATQGMVSGHFHASRVEIDSRKIQLGDLFVAIKGDRVDGHHYVADAFARGAVAAIVTHIPDGVPHKASTIIVPDTLKALEQLGHFARARSKAKIVGITGSVGKTSAKEMMKLALAAHGKTYATNGNYNNHIGTPLNLANLPPEWPFAVLEMGMNHAGEIAHLTNMVKPDIAIITTVDAVHLEFFDSVDAIADAKAEIFEAVGSGGFALLNRDNIYYEKLRAAAKMRGIEHIYSFGEHPQADAALIAYEPTAHGCAISAQIRGKEYCYALSATGKHFATASLSVLLACDVWDLPLAASVRALAEYSEVEGRGKTMPLEISGGKAWLVDDSYNASPVSMRAAFSKLDELWQMQGKKGRKLLALGDMRELGDGAPAMHAALADDIIALAFDKVFTVGALMQYLYSALPSEMRSTHVMEAAQLLPLLQKSLQADDLLLIKGSHGSLMYQLAASLKQSLASEKKYAV